MHCPIFNIFFLVSLGCPETFLFYKIFGGSMFSRVWIRICVCRSSKNRQKKRQKNVKYRTMHRAHSILLHPQVLLAAGYPYAHAVAAPHAVAATYAGLVHSSHVGVCTNYLGAQVPC